MALICTTSSGGENPGPPRARAFFEPGQAFVEEAFAPEADHIATHGERGSDVIIGQAFGGEQNHSGPDDLEVWQRILSRASVQDVPLLSRELDTERAFSWHPNSSWDARIAERLRSGKIIRCHI
jgi:hypothetical protein